MALLKSIIDIKDYSFNYVKNEKRILKNLNFNIKSGEFLVICGESGSGKTTLLKTLKQEIAPIGTSFGSIDFNIDSNDISMVFQNPDTQLVTSSVIFDLAFPMENSCVDRQTMQKRMAETVSYFGLEDLLHKSSESISGGQKQLVALCSALMMRPKLLLLDEPVSQLDPISAKEFLVSLKRINEDFGLSVILSEHRLDDVITYADRIILLKDGEIAHIGSPHQVMTQIWKSKNKEHAFFIPQIPKLSLTIDENAQIAFTPKQFKQTFLQKEANSEKVKLKKELDVINEKCVKVKEISYDYDGEYVLNNLSLDIYKNEFLCILGANGSGKSTLLKIISGILVSKNGYVKINGLSVGYIPQNLNTYFCTDTVLDEINESISVGKLGEEEINEILNKLDIMKLKDRHPYDLSGGQQQKVVLASVLLRNPDIIIMDEPTKGIDAKAKTIMAQLLKKCHSTVIMATHDIEFAAAYSDRCAMLFDSQISFCASSHEFFSESRFYTTAISRAVRHIWDDAILYKDVLDLCKIEIPSFLSDF